MLRFFPGFRGGNFLNLGSVFQVTFDNLRGSSTILLGYPHYLYSLQAVPVSSADNEGDNALSDMDERQQLRLMLLVSVFFLGGGN